MREKLIKEKMEIDNRLKEQEFNSDKTYISYENMKLEQDKQHMIDLKAQEKEKLLRI